MTRTPILAGAGATVPTVGAGGVGPVAVVVAVTDDVAVAQPAGCHATSVNGILYPLKSLR